MLNIVVSCAYMAITSSAKKAQRSSLKKRVFNIRRKRVMLSEVKDIKKAISAGDSAKAKEMLPGVYKAIDKAAKRGVIKKNTASRKKSRIVASLSKVDAK